MKKIVEYVEFFAGAIQAIAKGVKVTQEHWPANNPFNSNLDNNEKTKSQSKPSE